MIKLRPLRLFYMLAVPLLLTLGSVRLLLSYEYLRLEYQRADFPADPYGFTVDDRLDYGMFAISYLFNDEALDFLAALRLPREKCWGVAEGAADCPLFTSTALGHLQDVKRIVGISLATALVVFVAAVVIALFARRSSGWKREIIGGLRQGSRLTLGGVLVLAVLAVTAWNQAFDSFHEIFFAPGSWRFAFSDSLIRLYPEQVFVDAALIIGVLTSAGALLILVLASMWEKGTPGQGEADL